MSEIQVRKIHENDKAEMRMEILHTECGKNYTFVLRGNHIEVRGTGNTTLSGLDWFEDLTDKEKLQVFNKILAEYRPRSMGEGGFQLAALGVTDKGRIYISENTEQLSDPYNRQCAEQNMVTISSQREVYQQKIENIRAGKDTNDFVAQYPKYKALYLMGGRDSADLKDRIPIACPCGYCTDLLAKVMEPGAPVWIVPINNGEKDLSINDTAEMAKDLQPNEVWKTTIDYLNKERSITLPVEEADLQRNGMRVLCSELANDFAKQRKSLTPSTKADGGMLKGIKFLKHSISNGMPPAEVNKFQYTLIKNVLFDRLREIISREKLDFRELTPSFLQGLIEKNVESIRCATLELDSGKVTYAVQSITSVDKSSPSAEETAKGIANENLGTQGVRRVRVMEFNPKDIAALRFGEPGEMHTSRKGAIERLVKARSRLTDTVEFGFTPFNEGILSREKVEKIMRIRKAEDIFPGFFTGKGSQKIEAQQAKERLQNEIIDVQARTL